MSDQQKILIVEDEKLLNDLYTTKFRKEGFLVASAFNGLEGWQKLESFQPDLMLLDIIMPEMNGLELLEKIRANPAWQKLPVVILSVLGEPEDMQRAMQLGATSYIIKGQSDPAEVVLKVRELLAKQTEPAPAQAKLDVAGG